MRVEVQSGRFDAGDALNQFTAAQTGMGAVVSFTGIVRDTPDGTLGAMEIEHYPGMTEKALYRIAEEAMTRWSLGDVLVIHRYGALNPSDTIMMVATAAPHRRDAFEAADFLMDYLKSRAPFWKKEISGNGTNWVAAKQDDEDALTRW